MRSGSILVALAFFVINAYAQPDSTANPERQARYFSYFGSGVLLGKDGLGTTVSLSTVHGVRLNSIAIGLGIGYDDYDRTNLASLQGFDLSMRWKSVPLFMSLSADLGKIRENSLFIQLNGGYSFIRATRLNDMEVVENPEGGMMLSPSLAYRINAGKHRIYLGAGYKMQRNKYRYNPALWIFGPPPPQINVNETMQRMVVHIGFGWN